jgi:aminoglycoside 6'-N-acetyltransferase
VLFTIGSLQDGCVQFSIARIDVEPGQSWAEAADHQVAPAGPVLAVDLSDDPLRWRVDEAHRFAVRPMVEGDLPDVSRWVNQPHVARWWDEHRSLEQVTSHYGPALRGEDPTRLWVWEINGRSVGFAQDYRIADHPEFALLCGRPDAVGFDYAIGEPAFTDRGLGTSLLWVYLRDIVAPAHPDLTELFAAPDHRNVVSRRVLAKLGGVEGLWFDEPQAGGRTATVVGCSIDVTGVMGSDSVTGG